MSGIEDGFFTLIVECGRHGGVLQRLAPGRYTLGSDPEADFVLSDPGVAAAHVVLELAATGLHGRLTVRPEGGTVSVGSREFSPGSEITSSLPVAIRLAGIGIAFQAPESLNRRRSWIQGGAAAIAGGALAAFATLSLLPTGEAPRDDFAAGPEWAADRSIGLPAVAPPPKLADPTADLAAEFDGSPSSGPSDVDTQERLRRLRDLVARTASHVGGRVDVVEIDPESFRLVGYLPKQNELEILIKDIEQEIDDLRRIETRVVTVDAAAEALRRRLDNAGLADRVEVAPGNGKVTVTGEIDDERAPAWSAAQQWFDQRFGRHIVLDGRVAARRGPPGPPLSIRAVWTGDAPYVIAGNGQKYIEGALLDSGWKIEKIERDVIVLSRQGETLRLAL